MMLLLASLLAPPVTAQQASSDPWLAAIAASDLAVPVRVVSTERAHSVRGEVYARLAYPLDSLARELRSADAWCAVLFLHLNVKACLAEDGEAEVSGEARLRAYVGRRFQQPLAQAERLDLTLRLERQHEASFVVALTGDRGPYTTRAFRLRLEARALGARETLVHLRYSLVFGTPARLAMSAYFAFGGRDRIGFTVIGQEAGEPRYVGGVRGMIERNVMRFYLALEAYLAAPGATDAARLEARLADWFAATERYPRQLHELDASAYLDMKRREYARQQALP